MPLAPEVVRQPWTNTALRLPSMTDEQYDALRAAQVQSKLRDVKLIRQWWLTEMVQGDAPLRENLVLGESLEPFSIVKA